MNAARANLGGSDRSLALHSGIKASAFRTVNVVGATISVDMILVAQLPCPTAGTRAAVEPRDITRPYDRTRAGWATIDRGGWSAIVDHPSLRSRLPCEPPPMIRPAQLTHHAGDDGRDELHETTLGLALRSATPHHAVRQSDTLLA